VGRSHFDIIFRVHEVNNNFTQKIESKILAKIAFPRHYRELGARSRHTLLLSKLILNPTDLWRYTLPQAYRINEQLIKST
jgi:hypothetical protein